MVLCYALGGGLGHVARTRAVLAARGWGEAEVVSEAPARDPAGVRAWLERRIEETNPDALLVDAFPGGVLGELCGLRALDGIEVHHVARLLRWPVYRRRLSGPLPRFASIAAVEPLLADHAAALGGTVERLELPALEPPPHGDAWVVAHSGPDHELRELAALAEARRRREDPNAPLVVASGTLRPWPPAARLVTACGFNTMRELRDARERHLFHPLPRALDDQAERARRGLAEGGGLVAAPPTARAPRSASATPPGARAPSGAAGRSGGAPRTARA